jgi:ribosomal protein S11
MPYLIYKKSKESNNHYFEASENDTLIGVCNKKDAERIVKGLNKDSQRNGREPELRNFREQETNLEKKIQDLSAKKFKVDMKELANRREALGLDLRAISEMQKVANAELTREISAKQQSLQKVRSNIQEILRFNENPYYSVKVKLLK